MIFGIYKSKMFLKFKAPTVCLDQQIKRVFTKLSLTSALNNTMNVSISLIDVFLMGLIVSDMEMVASYKVATTIPAALVFIPAAIDVYIMPHFARNRENYVWVKHFYGVLIFALIVFNGLLCGGSLVFGPQIMRLLYGTEYQDTSICFIILMVGYFFSAIRMITFTVLYTQRKVHMNAILTVMTFIINLVLNMCLIPRFNSVGASVASMLTNAVTAIIVVGYLWNHFRSMQRAIVDKKSI